MCIFWNYHAYFFVCLIYLYCLVYLHNWPCWLTKYLNTWLHHMFFLYIFIWYDTCKLTVKSRCFGMRGQETAFYCYWFHTVCQTYTVQWHKGYTVHDNPLKITSYSWSIYLRPGLACLKLIHVIHEPIGPTDLNNCLRVSVCQCWRKI